MRGIINREYQDLELDYDTRSSSKQNNKFIGSIYSRGNLGLLVAANTTNKTLTNTNAIEFIDATAGNITITLAPANNWGSNKSPIVTLIRTDSSTNVVTVTPATTDKINGGTTGASITILKGMYEFISDSLTQWWYIGGSNVFGITPKAAGLSAPLVWGYNAVWATSALASAALVPYHEAVPSTAATTLQTVVNYTGSGVIDSLLHIASNTNTGQIKVTIDGLVALDLATVGADLYNIIGSSAPTNANAVNLLTVTPGTPIRFNTSILIEHKVTGGAALCYTAYRLIKDT